MLTTLTSSTQAVCIEMPHTTPLLCTINTYMFIRIINQPEAITVFNEAQVREVKLGLWSQMNQDSSPSLNSDYLYDLS